MTNDDTRLTELALGLLERGARDRLELTLRESPAIQQRLAAVYDVLEQVALAQRPVSPDVALKRRIIRAIDPATRFEGFVDRCAALFDLDVDRVRELLSQIDDASRGEWRTSGIPGVRVLRFAGGPRVAQASCGLVHVGPGRPFPAHRHRGVERVLVLQGDACDDSGQHFAPGDIGSWHAGSTHTFRAADGAPFVFAVVLEKPNRWLIWRTLASLFFRRPRHRK